MIKYTETLWDRFFNRLPETEAREAIRVLKRGGSFKDVDFFTLKEAEHQVSHFGQQAKLAIRAYRRWKTAHHLHRFFAVFKDLEGEELRGHARAMTSLFLDARRDYRELSALLMKSVANDSDIPSSKYDGGKHAR